MRFSTKLVLLVSGIVLVIGAVQAYLLGVSSIRSLEAQIVDRLEDRAFHTMDRLDRYFHERFLEAGALAAAPTLAFERASPRQLAATMADYLRWHPEFVSAALYGRDRGLIADTAPYGGVERADLEGAWGEIAAGRDFALVPSTPASGSKPLLLLTVVVRDGRGAARGLLVSRMPPGILESLVAGDAGPHRTEEHLRITLVDRTGLTLYTNDDTRGLAREISPDWPFIEPRLRAGESFGNLKHANPAEAVGEELQIFIRERGFRGYPGNGWTLSLRIPTSVVFAPAMALRNQMIVFFLVAGWILVAAVYLFVRAFTRPIVDLSRAAEEIGRGDLEARVAAVGSDELGRFAESFNRMAADLQASRRELTAYSRGLEAKVEERTAELLQTNTLLHAELSERAKAQEALEVRGRLLLLSAEIGEAMSLPEAIPTVLQRCATLLVRHLDAAFVRIWTLGDEPGTLELAASAGLYTRLDGQHRRKVFGERKVGIIAETQRPLLTNEVVGDPAITDQEWARREGMQAFAGHPLVLDGKTIGVMALFSRRRLDPVVIAALGAVADKVAAFIGRRTAEESLRVSEQRYRELFESSGDGIYKVDAAGVFTIMNPAGARIFGHATPAEIIGRHALEYWRDPADREAFREKLHREKSVSSYLIKAKKRDGQFLELESSSWVREDKNGVFLGIEGVLRDVTQRARADAERDLLIAQLQEATANIRTLSGLLPICAGCKKIRDEQGRWSQVETYVSARTEAEFSHGLCPDCSKVYFPAISGAGPNGKA